MSRNEAPRLAILIDDVNTYGTRRITAAVVEIAEDGSPRNLSNYGYDAHALANLSVACYVGHERDTTPEEHGELWGWGTEYRDLHTVDLACAQRMAKTLTTLGKRMDAAQAEFGYPATFAEYLTRVASCLRIKEFVTPRGARGSMYTDSAWRIMDANGARSFVADVARSAAVAA